MAIRLEFGGIEQFAASRERVFAVLTDLDLLVASLPDVASWERVDDRQMRCVVRPGFSFMRGTLKLAIELAESEAVERASLRVRAAGIGAGMVIESRLRLTELAPGTELSWQAQVDELKGLVATISPALLRAAADQVIRYTWDQVRRQLGE